MPLLAKETAHYPANLFDDYCHNLTTIRDKQTDSCWWTIYTKARQEKALAREMMEAGTPFFLPLVPHPRKVRGRRLDAHLPLFSGYMFVYAGKFDCCRHLATHRISMILPVDDQPLMHAELSRLHQLIEGRAELTVEKKLVAGDTVRIKNGPFKGLEGVLVRRQNRDHVQVAVTYLGQGVLVKIEDFCVERF